jgi:hypothetical protein
MGSRCSQPDNIGLRAPDALAAPLPRPVDGPLFRLLLVEQLIHDWNDQQAVAILRNCRRAMAPHGKVLVAETIIPAGNEPNPIKLIDANMLVVTGGKERTQAEYATVLDAAGLRLERVIPTSQPISLLEAGQV